MAKPVQQELFPRVPAKDYAEAVRQRLGLRDAVGVSDVAAACNVSVALVYSWIDQGLIEAVNVSSSDRPYYKVFVPSVNRFIKQRSEVAL